MGLLKYLRKEKAIIKDDSGYTVGTQKIKRLDETFTFNGRMYNVIRNGIYYDTVKGLIFTTRKYFYNVNNPMPLSFSKTSNAFEPIIDPTLYKKLMDNEVLIVLNSVKKKMKIDPVMVIIGLGVLALIIYFAKGGSLG